MVIKKIKGVIPPVIIPFKKDGSINYDMYKRNLEKWNEDMLSGYLILGSNSETIFLSEKEKFELVEETIEVADKNKHILVGTGLESTLETIRFTNKVAGIGIDAALVITPSFYKSQMTDQVLIKYYQEIADHSEVPIILYNVPKFTYVNLSIEAVHELSQHPNIIGIKESSLDIGRFIELKRVVNQEFNILAGTAALWFPALTLDIEGGILALANCAPNECSGIQELYEKGDIQEAKKMYLRMYPVNKAVTSKYGIPGLKYAANLIGYEGGEVRKPLQSLDKVAKEDIRRTLSLAQLFYE